MPKKEESPEKELEQIVKRYVENDDYFTAKNFIKTWGPQIKDYPADVKIQEIEKLEQKAKAKKED